ncbi:MAG: hypothetical protein ACE5O2_10645, partial [Armatimonadota bacterium]
MSHGGDVGVLLTGAILLGIAGAAAATPVAKKVIRAADVPSRERLENRQLDARGDGKFVGWGVWGDGYVVDEAVKRTGQASARCSNQSADEQRGISQTVTLDQREPRPIIASGWSKAEGVSASPDSGYSIYLDILYQDGTPLWGQTTDFATGTHDWQKRQRLIVPDKPIKRVTIYGLFRGHRGTAWFDDFSLREAVTPAGAVRFDGAVVTAPSDQAATKLAGHYLLVRDVAADSDFFLCGGPTGEKRVVSVDEIELNVTHWRELSSRDARPTRGEEGDRSWRWHVELEDLAKRDRAISVYLVQRLDIPDADLSKWRWWHNVRRPEQVERTGTYSNTVSVPAGAVGRMSLYPFSCISGPKGAFSWLLREPLVNRLAFDVGSREHYAAVDIGLSQDSAAPGRAGFAVDFAEVDARWGMRAAAQKYYELQPDYFDESRIPKKQGNWMAFTKISSVQRPEDFQFAVHEGSNDVRWDNEHGIMPFVYVEPASWWQRMPKEAPRTYDEAVGELEQHASSPDDRLHVRAWATKLSGIFDPDGNYRLWIQNAPWCDGCVFANNPDPDVPEDGEHLNQAHMHMASLERAMRGAEPDGGLAGVYLDSLEGWGFLTNHRRGHFKAASLPLTFEAGSKKVCLLNVFSTYEFTRHVREWVHAQGKLLMANSVPHRFAFLANLIDLMGTETNWLRDKKYAPPGADYMYIKRVMAWRKPYMFLMNTRYDDFPPPMVERYMQR